jgi:lysophospholipase L1-like esterase
MVRQDRLWVCITAIILFCGEVTVYAKPLIKSGDRIVFLGGTFIERMQNYGHVEAEISSRVSGVTFRNLGWSGDNVWGESRAVFGTVAQGFERLQRDMTLAQPSVIIVSYGANEAHEGSAGLERFVAGYRTLLKALKTYDTTIILITPRYYENLGPPLPDPRSYNAKLKIYIDAIASLATSENLPLIHLSKQESLENKGFENELQPSTWRVLPEHSGLTSNGMHFSAHGYQVLARRIADGLGLPKSTLKVIDKDGTDVKITDYTSTPDSVKFMMTMARIGSLQLPSRQGETPPLVSEIHMQFSNLQRGKYIIYIDGTIITRATANQLKSGVSLPSSFQQLAVKQAYELTAEKNMMFFHRHRPQNETYLFLFRKHEQGNNAVEVPQFDSIVDGFEKRIQAIQNSSSYRVEIRKG